MKLPFYFRIALLLTSLYLFVSPATAQSNLLAGKPVKTMGLHPSMLSGTQAGASRGTLSFTDCNNDQTSPVATCPNAGFSNASRAAYLVSNYGEPWGIYHNQEAMNAVFDDTWDYTTMEAVDAGSLFSPAYKVVFLEGSVDGGYVLDNFLSGNQSLIENWVASGGSLFISCAMINAPAEVNLGFGGVTCVSFFSSDFGFVQEPSNLIFNGPYSPANGDFTASTFNMGYFSGEVGQVLITGNTPTDICLSVKEWGKGRVYFSTLALPIWASPYPNIQFLRYNILADLNNHVPSQIVLQANAGDCSAQVPDASFDASATDDCALLSLTHDVAGAPSNTSLQGAVFPVGLTTVAWLATDASGNTGVCESIVWTRDQTPPTVECPADITVQASLGSCYAEVGFSLTATDDCSTPVTSSIPLSGNSFFNGTHQVTGSATDGSGNVAYCNFLITVLPNAEICNGIDDDCDGWTDEDPDLVGTFYLDADFDGYGNPDQSVQFPGCYPPWGYAANALDCNDNNYYIHPGMWEYCNDIDDNCDGQIDEGVVPVWYQDADNDGFGNANVQVSSCNQQQGYVSNNWDCDDTDAYINPNAREDCTNSTDENCDGILGDNNFSIEETHADVFCGSTPDGSIEISMTPAQNYVHILWSNGVCCTTNLYSLDAGTYKVTVTNECGTTKTKSIQILPSAEPALKVTLSGTPFLCYEQVDGSISSEVQDGCGGYTYAWSTGSTETSISNLPGGYYYLTVTDACGCSVVKEHLIQPNGPVWFYYGSIIPLLDGSYFVQIIPEGGTPPYQFRRSLPGGGFTDWSSSNGFIGVPAGDHVFEMQDQFGCVTGMSLSLAPFSPKPLDEPQQVAERTEKMQEWRLQLFPNPNPGHFELRFEQPVTEALTLGVTDLSGRLLQNIQLQPGTTQHTVRVENLPAGTYLTQVISGGKVVAIEKFVKQ